MLEKQMIQAIAYRSSIEGPNERIPVAILGSSDGGFRLDYRVDASNFGQH